MGVAVSAVGRRRERRGYVAVDDGPSVRRADRTAAAGSGADSVPLPALMPPRALLGTSQGFPELVLLDPRGTHQGLFGKLLLPAAPRQNCERPVTGEQATTSKTQSDETLTNM